ncbi:class A beta-lactamase-related serine hydrolase, partial [bacterium]
DITLRQLLSHRAGLPTLSVPKGTVYNDWRRRKDPLPQQRIEYVKGCLTQEPVYPPGTKVQYSNFGFVIGGAIAERIAGEPWEELIKKRLFDPLGMTSATFGTQFTEKPVEPWPHTEKDGQPVPVTIALEMDLPPVAGPAGIVRCSLSDWAKYASFWLKGLRGESDLLDPETFQFLTTPPDSLKESGTDKGDGYSCGWRTATRNWSRDTVFHHGGTNLKNYSKIWMAPAENFAVLVVTNRGDALTPLDDVSAALSTELARLGRM